MKKTLQHLTSKIRFRNGVPDKAKEHHSEKEETKSGQEIPAMGTGVIAIRSIMAKAPSPLQEKRKEDYHGKRHAGSIEEGGGTD